MQHLSYILIPIERFARQQIFALAHRKSGGVESNLESSNVDDLGSIDTPLETSSLYIQFLLGTI